VRSSFSRRRLLFWCVTIALPLLCAAGSWHVWRTRQPTLTGGKKLNRAAWEASFEERRLPVPSGPRDGFWGGRMPAWVRHPEIGWHEAEAHMPGLVDEDANGLQRLRVEGAEAHVLILGGSVAWGAYASRIEETYFAHAARLLSAAGVPADVTVFAAGAWTSEHELKALRLRGPALRPDVVVFLDGLNDLTQGQGLGEHARVNQYLAHLHEARDVAQTLGASVLISLQPTLTAKRWKTAYERRILELMADKLEMVPTAYAQMRVGLRGLEDERGTRFVDCSDAFSRERSTTFTDIWHFADPGHRLLGDCLADGLAPMLLELRERRRGPDPWRARLASVAPVG
jgi:lysophospholipase L1-like esterase